jgi:serine/threonine-protein kinase
MRQNRLIGRQVAGRFTIKRFLGEGGMATVYVAEQPGEPHLVALKVMNEDLNADRTFVKRFQREAKAAARVQHPNSVHIIDYGVAENISYIAMELLEGDDLYVLLEREGAITQARAVRILIEVCDALMVAHELGIVHRDLKPENIMVVGDPAHPQLERVKVLDFGIAKLLAPDTGPADPRLDPASAVTRAGTFIGTPAYMSPEQCALLPVDTRADIYTCGVLLFQLVTGRLPFEGQTPLHTATLHIHEAAPRPSTFAPGLDPRLEAIIMKALSKKPTDRHQTARHLASTLRKLLPELADTRVAKAGRPAPGSLRAGGARPPPGRDGSSPALKSMDDPMESANTMVAQGAGGPPASVVLHGAASRVDVDSAPARIRPAAGRPPAPPPDDDDDPSSEDEEVRTLIRAPLEETAPRFTGPQNTEVMVPPSDAVSLLTAPTAAGARAAALAAKSPPAPVAARPGAPRVVLGQPVTSAPDSPPPTRPGPPPRIPKPTLKSSEDFKPGAPVPPALVVAPVALPAPPRAITPAARTAPDPLDATAPALESEPERDSKPAVPAGDRASSLPDRQVVVTPAAFPETGKVDGAEPAAVNPTAQTVPMISPAMVAAVIAAGPQGVAAAAAAANAAAAAGTAAASAAAGGPALLLPAPGPAATAPLLPPTPPIYPLAPPPAPEAGVSRISGARGLLIGFLAGAVIMALLAGAYVIFAR